MRKTLAVLENKPVKDLKMLLEGWDSQVISDTFEERVFANGTLYLEQV